MAEVVTTKVSAKIVKSTRIEDNLFSKMKISNQFMAQAYCLSYTTFDKVITIIIPPYVCSMFRYIGQNVDTHSTGIIINVNQCFLLDSNL